ncbi:unnamed protein product [Cylindrotheca closterium]|uniref:Methyltransferase type 11 domain-containing protein n=1 Tax=Cylindrotheca closterium TaxID=2856 RepID=A0AAD2G4J2_9STRA|nr:unnamed protein product [Cylindrotheca closterium]
MANKVPRAPLIVGGGLVYAGACALAFSVFNSGNKNVKETNQHLEAHREKDPNFSFVSDPCRACRFQNVANKYDKEIGRDESVMGINLLRRSLLYFHSKGLVLEVGAGTGRNVDFYPSAVDRVVLMDLSDKMLAEAKKKLYKDQKPQFACVVGDSTSLDFPDDSFDSVVDTFGLCSYDDPVVVLKEMSRVCKPDGKILLLEHGRSKTWDSITQYLDRNAERHARNWGCVWNRDLDRILEEAGLRLETLTTWHFGTTYYVVCKPSNITQ